MHFLNVNPVRTNMNIQILDTFPLRIMGAPSSSLSPNDHIKILHTEDHT